MSFFLHGDIDNFGDIANIATFASAFFLSFIASECYSDIFLLRRARDESLVIPWRYLGGSLDVTLPNTYPKRIKTTKIPRLGRVGGILYS